MMFVEKGNIARTAGRCTRWKRDVRGPLLFVHKGLFGTRPGIKITVAAGSTRQKPALQHVI